jgi:DNA polymerase-3 subunit delta'
VTFAPIIGHDRQKEILRRALAAGRIPHAYLFEGPEGVGKRLVALALARAIFCRDGGCGDCPACRKVDHHNHPDLHLVEPDGSFIRIEQVRDLQREFAFRPLEASRKICLIDGADRLNPAAANALLKTLEEPAGNALLILLAAQGENVLPTIRSRCQRLPFCRLPRERLREVLQDRLGLEEAASHVLAALSEGSFCRALGKNRELFLERRRELLKGLTALSGGSIVPLLEFARQLAEDKEHLPDILEIFQVFYRDVLLYLHGCPEDDLVNLDLLEKIRRAGSRETPASLLRKLEALAAGRRHLDRNVNRELALDLLLLRLAA